MTKRTRNQYLDLRQRHQPKNVRLVIIAESPPDSGLYFYDPKGKTSEPLFAATMKQLGFLAATKEDGLHEFQERGFLLVDATYEPVNRLSSSARDAVIARDYPLLRDDLTGLVPHRETPIILIKSNVCRALEPKLVHDGFRVLNSGTLIPFPSSGRQPGFHERFKATLKSAGLAALLKPPVDEQDW